jgi:hypothetical protein
MFRTFANPNPILSTRAMRWLENSNPLTIIGYVNKKIG